MEKWELEKLNAHYEDIKPYMTDEGIKEVEKQGKYLYDREFGWVTPTINGGICAYGIKDKTGTILCGIEQAYNDGKLDLCIIKPFPIYSFPKLVYRMFSKTSNLSRFVEIIQGNHFQIKRVKSGPVHLDGEPTYMGEDLSVTIKHLALELVI